MARTEKKWTFDSMSRGSSRWVTFGSLTGLALGIVFGVLIHDKSHSHFQGLLFSLEPLTAIWLRALRLIVLPLVVCVLVVSIAPKDGSHRVGKMGGLTLVCFSSILLLGAVFSLAAGFVLVRGLNPDPSAFAYLHATLANAGTQGAAAPLPHWAWTRSLISSNLLKAVMAGRILPMLAATILFALLLRNLSPQRRNPIVKFFNSARKAAIGVLRLLFCALPAVAFILIASVTSRTGLGVAKSIGYYLIAICGTLLAFTALQYLIARLVGGTSVRLFARGVVPAQAAAVATRSSLASLPALLDGAQNRLGLPPAVSNFVLPLSVSTFKASQPVFATFKLIFLARLFGVPLDSTSLAAFIIGVFVLSFVTPGVPSAGSINTIPLLLALGIPLQGVLLLNSVAEIPDIFETLLNVTADMTVATMVARFVGVPQAAADSKPHPSGLLASAMKFPG